MSPTEERGRTPVQGLTVLRDGDRLPETGRGGVAAIGNFDGVHLGHQALVAEAIRLARATDRVAAVVTFEPHPRDFFRPEAPSFRLTGEAEKLHILRRHGLDVAIVLRFDGSLAATTAEEFVTRLLARDYGLSHVVVGENFHFGRGRAGTPAILSALATASGMAATILPAVSADAGPVSSSRIREALETGAVEEANRLLGHRWFVSGPVIHGEKRGRELGYPTANVRLGAGSRLAHGIYAVRAAIGPGQLVGGVASFGSRPTFDDGPPLLETHLFDFAGDLYGREMAVEFLGRIRPEERFDSARELVRRMDVDAVEARAVLARPDLPPSMID